MQYKKCNINVEILYQLLITFLKELKKYERESSQYIMWLLNCLTQMCYFSPNTDPIIKKYWKEKIYKHLNTFSSLSLHSNTTDYVYLLLQEIIENNCIDEKIELVSLLDTLRQTPGLTKYRRRFDDTFQIFEV